jgi:hypothetical protein
MDIGFAIRLRSLGRGITITATSEPSKISKTQRMTPMATFNLELRVPPQVSCQASFSRTGCAQETGGDVKGDGGSGGWLGVFTGIGAKPPYGDKQIDQFIVQRGFQYYKSGCQNQ